MFALVPEWVKRHTYSHLILTSCSFEPDNTDKSTLSSRRVPASPRLGEMERSTQELFLNFMIVLITVLLMWLLVRTYQES